MNRYKVKIFIAGAHHRPPYNGYVEVQAKNEYEASDRAISKLRASGTWDDCWRDDFKIKGIAFMGKVQ